MQLHVITTFLVSGTLLAAMGFAILFYSLAGKETRPILWAAMASGAFAVCMFLAAFRGRIPDFFSIIVLNELVIFSLIAFFEAFRRLFSASSRERFVGPMLLVIQFILFMRYTYFQPDFHARVVVFSVSLAVMCACIIKLIVSNMTKSHPVFHILALIPFVVLFFISMAKIFLFLSGRGLIAPSFTSPIYALSMIIYSVCAVWIVMSVMFMVSNRLQARVAEMALTDPLTGALNRRALENETKREIARVKRNGEPLSLILTDLDHFKKINDKHGHQAGDAILAHVVSVYRKILRTQDLLARYGGEEFVIVLPGTDVAQALSVAERMRKACKDHPLVFGNRPIPVTSSFGVTGYDEKTDEYETLVKHADEALYRAKKEGRDRVVLFKQA